MQRTCIFLLQKQPGIDMVYGCNIGMVTHTYTFVFKEKTELLFCFVFRPYAFAEAAALRSIAFHIYAGVPIATRVFLLLFFLDNMSLFPIIFSDYFFRFLFVRRVRRTFIPYGWCFSTLFVATGWIFYISL